MKPRPFLLLHIMSEGTGVFNWGLTAYRTGVERELKRRLKKKYALTKTQSYTTSRRVLAKYASDASSDTGHVPLNSTRALSGHGAGPQAGGVGLTASSRRGSLGGSTRSLEGSSPILGPSGPRLWGSSPLWRRMTEPASAVGSAGIKQARVHGLVLSLCF